ncbi:hypothetical protein EYF80_003731 [Liparis tanakae]|uniref:Uncharacterized protein n=1 Tax=Liparis tanakae TaxID=230148 RepID=A0A4Z2J780_9TELE|nr:hypothetical protein EYF80_003731 [Liparis tanakae]
MKSIIYIKGGVQSASAESRMNEYALTILHFQIVRTETNDDHSKVYRSTGLQVYWSTGLLVYWSALSELLSKDTTGTLQSNEPKHTMVGALGAEKEALPTPEWSSELGTHSTTEPPQPEHIRDRGRGERWTQESGPLGQILNLQVQTGVV